MAARALTQGILKLIAKIKASPSALVKFADKICEISVALPAALAPKVEWIRFPPAPYKVFSTPSRDSFEMADAQNAKNFINCPHHQKHEKKDGQNDEKAAIAAK